MTVIAEVAQRAVLRTLPSTTVGGMDLAARYISAAEDALVGGVVGDEDFVTAVVAEFHPDRTVAVVKCGHPPPVKVSARWRSAGPAWVGTVNYDRP